MSPFRLQYYTFTAEHTSLFFPFGWRVSSINTYKEYSLNSPASCRSTVAKLCELTGARALSVSYRLAPQHPFPAAILDVLVAYFSLLCPPPDSFHEAVPASSIVLAGDSAGAALCVALVQTILRFQEERCTIWFHNQDLSVTLPAGVAVLSLAGDLTQALPSWTVNGQVDILRDAPPTAQPSFPSDSVWPSNPPRYDPYCDDALLSHPLVAPATTVDWKGAPPFWIACGEERLADSSKIIAQTAASQGVLVLWEQYQAMPHTWALIFPKWPQSIRCMASWAHACRSFANPQARLLTEGKYIHAKHMNEENVLVTELTPLTPQKALRLMESKIRDLKPFVGAEVKPSL